MLYYLRGLSDSAKYFSAKGIIALNGQGIHAPATKIRYLGFEKVLVRGKYGYQITGI